MSELLCDPCGSVREYVEQLTEESRSVSSRLSEPLATTDSRHRPLHSIRVHVDNQQSRIDRLEKILLDHANALKATDKYSSPPFLDCNTGFLLDDVDECDDCLED